MITLTVKQAAKAAGCNYSTMMKAGRAGHVETFLKRPDQPADKKNPTMVRAESRAALKQMVATHYPRAGFTQTRKVEDETPHIIKTEFVYAPMGAMKFLEVVPAEKRQVLADMSRFTMERLTMLLALGQEE